MSSLCFPFTVHIMGDVKLVTSTRVSKTSLTLSPSVPAEAPAFTLPPRNIRVQLGATARFEGKVRNRDDELLLHFVFSWGCLVVCAAHEISSPIWDLYSRRLHQCFRSCRGRSLTGLFLSRGECCKTWLCADCNLDKHNRDQAKYQWKTASRAVSNQRAHILLWCIDLPASQSFACKASYLTKN